MPPARRDKECFSGQEFEAETACTSELWKSCQIRRFNVVHRRFVFFFAFPCVHQWCLSRRKRNIFLHALQLHQESVRMQSVVMQDWNPGPGTANIELHIGQVLPLLYQPMLKPIRTHTLWHRLNIRLQFRRQALNRMVPQIGSWTFRGRYPYLINESSHGELPAIDRQRQPAILLFEEIKSPFLPRHPMIDPVSNNDWIERRDILADVTLPSEIRPTMPVDLIDKLRSAGFCHDCPQSFRV